MNAAFDLARRYGVRVAFADLGDWGAAELRSEYDPSVPAIRVNVRVLARLPAELREKFVATAVAHEIYHHREHLGEQRIVTPHAAREAAADAFARAVVAQ